MAELRAEMVANVLAVVVTEGERVAEGDTVLVLESMKMEIPVLAEHDATVRSLLVGEGQVVRAGDLLAILD